SVSDPTSLVAKVETLLLKRTLSVCLIKVHRLAPANRISQPSPDCPVRFCLLEGLLIGKGRIRAAQLGRTEPCETICAAIATSAGWRNIFSIHLRSRQGALSFWR